MPLNPKNQWWKNVIKKLPEKYKNYCGISNITTSILKLISVKKDIYRKRLTRKVADPLTCSKTYWFILKPFNNNKTLSSSGCNPVNCLSQTRRNLTTEHLNLNFVTTPKLKPLHSSYAGKVFIFYAFGSFPFCKWVHVQAFAIAIFCSLSFGIENFQLDWYLSIFSTSWKEKNFFLKKCKGSSWRLAN